jgi:hypothetical protein
VTIRKNNDFLIKKKERYMKKTDFMTPFIKITKTTRLYALPTIIDWLKGRNVILGAETENESGQNDS